MKVVIFCGSHFIEMNEIQVCCYTLVEIKLIKTYCIE